MSIGKIEEFDLNGGNWKTYIARVRQYFLANEVREELKTAILITLCGSRTYDLMLDLTRPAAPEDKDFDELVQLVKDHMEPKPCEISERVQFRRRKQEAGESISTYTDVLKKLAATCNFGEDKLEENLRDQLVFGLRDEAIRQIVYLEKDLTYEKVVEIATNMETAEINAGKVDNEATTRGCRNPERVESWGPQQQSPYCRRWESLMIPSHHNGKIKRKQLKWAFKQAKREGWGKQRPHFMHM